MDIIEFLNQNPFLPSWPGVIEFGIVWELLRENGCVFSLAVLLRVLLILFPMLLIHSSFYHVLFFAIFYSQIVLFPYLFSCWYVFLLYSLLASRIFPLFWNVLFFLYCFILSWYHFSLLSFDSTFWFISSSWIVSFTGIFKNLFVLI